MEAVNILSFKDATRKRRLPKARKRIIPAELRLYNHCIEKSISDWKLEATKKADNSRHLLEIEDACTLVFECFQTFILSGGQWRGAWPRFAIGDDGILFVKQCLRDLYWVLGGIHSREFHQTILLSYQSANRDGVPLHIELDRDFDTFIALFDFANEMMREVARQSQSAHDFRSRRLSTVTV